MTPILFNNNENPTAINFNNEQVQKVYFNNVLVWEYKVVLWCFESNTNTNGKFNDDPNFEKLYARSGSSSSDKRGYCYMFFPNNERFTSFQTAIFSYYCLGNNSNLDIHCREKGDLPPYNQGFADATSITVSSTTGWHHVDITNILKVAISNGASLSSKGLALYFRSGSNNILASHVHPEYPPYLTLI